MTGELNCRIGCRNKREKAWHLLCPSCWAKIPLPMQEEVYAAYRKCHGSPRHIQAIKACLEYLRKLDAHNPKKAVAS